MNSNKTFWTAFITGLTAGAIVALLYAPNDGKSTRKKLGRVYDDAEDYVEDAADFLKDKAERLTKETTSAYEKSRKQLDEVYTKASEALADAYSDAKETLAAAADTAMDNVDTVTRKARSLV